MVHAFRSKNLDQDHQNAQSLCNDSIVMRQQLQNPLLIDSKCSSNPMRKMLSLDNVKNGNQADEENLPDKNRNKSYLGSSEILNDSIRQN